MKNRYVVRTSPVVDRWEENPHPDHRIAEQHRRRFIRAVQIIERSGPLAGDDDLKKLRDNLYQTRVFDWRVLSTLNGHVVTMGDVVAKKKGKLSARELDVAEQRISAFLASQK